MKLRSKQTGEIMEFDAVLVAKDVKGNEVAHLEYDSIQKFTDQWEDVEEPKEYWYINEYGSVTKEEGHGRDTIYDKSRKNFGNYFLSPEEAELVVRKLDAWRRLKDKGFRFYNWDLDADDEDINVLLSSNTYKGCKVYDFEEDLDLLFSGEDD